MITRVPIPEQDALSRADRWRQAWLVVFAAAVVLLVAVLIVQQFTATVPSGNPAAASSPFGASPSAGPPAAPSFPALESGPASAPPAPSAPALESGPASAPPSPAAVSSNPFPEPGVLRLSGSAPTRGSGRFEYSTARSPVAGAKGPLRRYRVAVEKGSNEDAEAFAAQVRSTLGDKRSWPGTGRVRLQQVAGADHADFTVYLATRETAGQMCARGGTNIRIGGVPYTSCRTAGRAVINLDRWRGSARPYLAAKVDLAVYRQYVINHEVGHELGHRHQGCPKAGGPAPVMVQQTITLRGCVPYAWPRRNNRDLSGAGL